MPVNDWIEIYHPRSGVEYQVLAADFERNPDGMFDGFRVRRYVDAANGEYLAPDERRAARAEATPEAEPAKAE